MFRHFLLIANRNLLKYKVQNIISITSLAVGITTLAVVQCFLYLVRKPAIYSEPYADRCHAVILVHAEPDGPMTDDSQPIRQEADDLLRGGGGLISAESLMPVNYSVESGWVTFTMDDGTVKHKPMDLQPICNGYMNFRGFTSAVTGQKVPVLGRNEVMMSEPMACTVFGDINHIGATVSFNIYGRDIDFTLADVYRQPSAAEQLPASLQFSIWEPDYYKVENQYIIYYELMLRPGYTLQQFCDEANQRLKPTGLQVMVMPLADAPVQGLNISNVTRSLIWLVGSMVLLVSLISFIRMQIQLLRMRRREFSLRLINGASGSRLFLMLLTENAIVVLLSVALAWILLLLLQSYTGQRLMFLLNDINWTWRGATAGIWGIGLAVFLICTAITAIALRGVMKRVSGLQENLRSSDGMFHKVMLVLQTVICTLFISGTISVLLFVSAMRERMHVPANDRDYKHCIMLRADMVSDPWALRHELEKCRYAEKVIPYNVQFSYGRLDDNDTVRNIINNARIYSLRNYVMPDTAFFDFFGLKINRLRDIPDDSYILASEELYSKMQEAGYGSNSMLQTYDGRMLPVVGTFPPIPYSSLRSQAISIAVINPESDITYTQFILQPKKGEYQELMSEANYIYTSTNPELVDVDVYNLRDQLGSSVNIFDAMRTGAIILSFICLIICITSIYSTLLLSIRSRRKEVAIRKVVGARRSDVMLMFGRLYMVMALISILFCAPLGVIFNDLVISMSDGMLAPGSIPAWIPVAGSSLLMLLFITVTVMGNIRSIMRLNPSDYIAKE